MRVTLESTTRTVEIVAASGERIPARVWEGKTDKGIRCYALITRIAVHKDDDAGEFEQDLREQRAPSAEAARAFDSRLVL